MPRVRMWFTRGWKPALALVIIVLVARHFYRILSRPELNPYPFALRVEYLLPAGLLVSSRIDASVMFAERAGASLLRATVTVEKIDSAVD